MAAELFDYADLLRPELPPAAARWAGFPEFNFVGGHNDADSVPVDGLVAAATAVLKREGRTLSTYGLESGPLGYRPLREYIARKLARDAGITCSSDEVLITSGSLQGLDLVNQVLLSPGDTVIVEQMILAEYCPDHFADPAGGIFLWVKLPDDVDTTRLTQLALQSGVAINPGAEWMTDDSAGRARLRLCFVHPSEQAIREGVASLAGVCHREFAVPARHAKQHR